jgi:hypothetical protein
MRVHNPPITRAYGFGCLYSGGRPGHRRNAEGPSADHGTHLDQPAVSDRATAAYYPAPAVPTTPTTGARGNSLMNVGAPGDAIPQYSRTPSHA